MIVYAPLSEDHPLVVNSEKCSLCHESFRAMERVTLVPIEISSDTFTKRALPMHVGCALKGRKYDGASVVRVKDGDASPYPVILSDGRQSTFAEIGLLYE